MPKPLLRPRWLIAHVLAAAAVVVFVVLGMWQLERHGQKRDLRAAAETAMAGPPRPWDGHEDSVPYRRVVVDGVYDPALQVYRLQARQGRSGHLVLTPLRSAGGPAILVARGWVPIELDPPVAAATPPTGEVTVTGVLWPAEAGAALESLPLVVPRTDPAILGRFADYPMAAPYLIATDPPPVEPLLSPEIAAVALGPHLGYAGQWFLFAGVVLVGYPILLRRRR